MRKGPLKNLSCVAQELEFTGLHAQTILPERTHNLIHRLAGWFIIVEEVATKEDHVDITSLGELHDLIKGTPTVILPNGISLLVANMVIA